MKPGQKQGTSSKRGGGLLNLPSSFTFPERSAHGNPPPVLHRPSRLLSKRGTPSPAPVLLGGIFLAPHPPAQLRTIPIAHVRHIHKHSAIHMS